MAYNDESENNQNGKITSSDFLPRFYRTNANRKFLQATLDQLIQPGEAEKIQGYFGRRTAKAYKQNDNYIGDVNEQRNNYQLEPAMVIKDNFDNVDFYKDYNDYVNQLGVFGANTTNHSRLNSQETYAWNPNIDWDKFVNFREYYWMPNGPQTVGVRGQSREVVSTYTVTTVTEDDNTAFVFNDGFTRNPTLKLYRGQTYRFEVDTPGHPIAFAISRTFTPGSAILVAGREGIRSDGLYDGTAYDAEDANYDLGDFVVLPSSGSVTFEDDDNVSTIYPDGIRKFGEEGDEIATVYLEKGTIEFSIPENAPDRLYYISKNDIDTSGYVRIADIEENTFLDITNDILGKKTYTSANGIKFTNGLKITFQGDVTPSEYSNNEWYVEGVGDKIKLIKDTNLIIPAAYSENRFVPFDSENFDTLPFSNAKSYTADKDYIVVNRASTDRNAWSRYNKWFHKSVIEASAEYNGVPDLTNEDFRAKRPIIEFEAGLKLFNYGSSAKQDVDLIDTVTTDVFSTIEGEIGYRVDGVNLAENMRVLFTADTDKLVNGKIYLVKFITIGNRRQINLIETTDAEPKDLETVLVVQGRNNAGKSYFYNGTKWQLAQEKTEVNQEPLFDVFGIDKISFGDTTQYIANTFIGTKLFSYKRGTGANDTELNFPLTYRNISNSGDIVFEFNLLTDKFQYEEGTNLFEKSINPGFLKKYKDLENFEWVNGFTNKPYKSVQKVIQEFVVGPENLTTFEVDCYKDAGEISDIKINAFVNSKIRKDYTLERTNKKLFVVFDNDLDENDFVVIKSKTKTAKNEKGYYEFPINLERNPNNEDFTEFTLGEAIDHVDTMVEDLQEFAGVYPGISNLRDLGDVDRFGKRFVKHSGSINLSGYHVTNKNYNLVKSLEFSRREYARFKRNFLEKSAGLGIDTETKQHVDAILRDLNKDKQKTEPFYFSDMLGYQSEKVIEHVVQDTRSRFYSLSEDFDLDTLTNKSVNAYINGVQLTFGIDYDFTNDGFINLFADFLEVGDKLTVYEYSSTDGSYIPPTPTKLGLYPKYAPTLIYDDTFRPEAGETADDGTAYKIYAQSEKGYKAQNQIGWFYPLYTDKQSAENADSANGGNGTAHSHMFVGSNIILYMPNTGGTHAGVDATFYDEYPIGQPMIRGHDGSYVRAYNDYRDNLLIELEKRIFNNIKVNYNADILNVSKFVGGEFRDSDYSREEINSVLLVGFSDWLSILDNDYSNNYFYLRQDEFTFNYGSMKSFNGNTLPGFWRGIYQNAFDTDRPHTAPWEMLGLTIKPDWWNDVYGPAPYTGDNLLLWEDLEQGKIAEPGNIRYDNNYARPGLSNCIPVDSKGMLLSPLRSNFIDNFILRPTVDNFAFGDWAPVENAWRRSSEYPFSILTAMVLNKPAETIGLGFDISRIQKNFANQYIYNPTSKVLKIDEILLPNTVQSNERIMTSGLVNYISNLISSNILKVYEDYQSDLKNLTNQLGLKLGGFSDKNKINVILDSRSIVEDQSQDGVFIPQENYDVFLNTSSPTDLVVYSGIIIEKGATGFIVRGYSQDNPYFEYYSPRAGSKSITVTVGGLVENAMEWRERTPYVRGQLVENNSKFYRVTQSFTSGQSFETDFLAVLSTQPILGGKSAEFDKNFDLNNVERIPYGHRFSNSQEVITFILGYGERLKQLGFEFTYTDTGAQIDDWSDAAKEFLFWTTQGWAAGTVISISPGANRLYFDRDYHVVDDLADKFYNYSIYDENGQPLDLKFNSILRDQNSFGLEVINSDHGLYHLALPIVQKEHVVLFDNKTVFNDILYQPSTGYRQERLKINAYRTADWQGGFNVPGFVFDDARYKTWEEYKDYQIGDLVKYRQYYYTATQNIVGSNVFDDTVWYRLSKEPEKQLLTNFDYRINQFMDYYDLDSAGFDEEQQELAQHLIGYQKRQYLANIINDDVSQFKFYNGYIQDKGTINSVTKLFDSLSDNTEDKVQLFEEWAIQLGQYGSTDNEIQLEYNLTDSKLEEAPQIFELANSIPKKIDKIYRLLPADAYDKPTDYNHTSAFPVKAVNEYLKTGGYVNEDHVTFVAYDKTELAEADVNQIDLGSYIWLIETGADNWTVYQIVDTDIKVLEAVVDTGEFTEQGDSLTEFTLDKWTNSNIQKNDIFGILNATDYSFEGLYTVERAELDKVYAVTDQNALAFDNQNYALVKMREVRVENLSEVNNIIQDKQYDDQRFWINNFENGTWNVIENNAVFSERQTVTNPSDWTSSDQEFGENIAISSNNRTMVVSSPNDEDGKITVYYRPRENSNFVVNQEITYENPALDSTNARFGHSVDISPDGEYIAVGMPKASDIKTRLLGEFDPDTTYSKNDIVKYRESHWQALRTIDPRAGSQSFTTFDSYQSLISDEDTDSTDTVLLVAGNAGLNNSIADHLLVRAPSDMYLGTKGRNFTTGEEEAGDTIKLYWNKRSYANPTLDTYLPFDNSISQITADWISSNHEIIYKVDAILEIETFIALPEVGDFVTTITGRGEVVYVASKLDSAVIYISNTNGIFDVTGELYIDEEDFVGLYSYENTYSTSENIGGYWLIKTYDVDAKPLGNLTAETSDSDGFTFNNHENHYDVGRGLVYADVRLSDSDRELNDYYNIQDTVADIGTYVLNKNRTSFITQLSYRGDPAGADGQDGTERALQSDIFVVRVGKEFSDDITAGDSYKFQLYDLENRPIDYDNLYIPSTSINKTLTIDELWDGYIDLTLSRFDSNGFAFEPQPKYYHDTSGVLQTRTQGDIIIDEQTPNDGAGGLAVSSLDPTSAAEVVYIQRSFNAVRVYLKIVDSYVKSDGTTQSVSGRFDQLNNIGKYELKRTASTTIRGPGDVDRVFGEVEDSNNNITLGTAQVGKLLVFRNGTTFTNTEESWEDTNVLIDEEYYFFNETTESGITIPANPPYSLNKDYRQIYNLPADNTGTAGPDNAGAIVLYRKRSDNTYEVLNTYTSFRSVADREFGSKVRLIQTNNAYTLLVGTKGVDSEGETDNTGRREHPGEIEIFRHGTTDTENFAGLFQLRDYVADEIVIYKDQYYKAKRPVEANVLPTDPVYWDNISWRYGLDINYRGEWDNSYSYAEDNIVQKDNILYKANTNIAADAPFTTSDWSELDSKIDYLGYLPNLTGMHLYDEDVFDTANISDFSQTFDISDDGQVLIVKALLVSADSYTQQRVAVYRQYDNKFQLNQVIESPNDTTKWGRSVSLNPAGDKFAISAELNDDFGINKGVVYVYSLNNGQFELSQTLQSPQNEISEQFGFAIDFGAENLVVSSLNGDQLIPTTFDSQETTFDGKFTSFQNVKLDKGVVYVYELVGDELIYAEDLIYPQVQQTFGEHLYSVNNHIYVGMPEQSNVDNRGQVVDYRKNVGSTAWESLDQQILPVDIDKISGILLYNKRTNEFISRLDYIDPLQGKIAGPAEQEIDYKVGFDPAVYNTGLTSDFLVDPDRFWGKEHAGEVWWATNTARFAYPYKGTINNQKRDWNRLISGSSIDIFEWVESDYVPEVYDEMADTDKGLALGISGQTLYGNTRYSTQLVYDKISQNFRAKYYFWVQNKRTKPTDYNPKRKLNCIDLANLIEDPRKQGYRFASLVSENKFILNNCNELIQGDDVVLQIRYKQDSELDINRHLEYQILSEGLESSELHPDIERKWYDSLIGFDTNNRPVPDITIPQNKRYGIQNKPRQGMFKNRFEALKQVIERANITMSKELLIDSYDLSAFSQKESLPNQNEGEYDFKIDTKDDLRFISTNKVKQAKIDLIISNGKIISANIIDAGRGYKFAPSYNLEGPGEGALLNFTINNLGQITAVDIENSGSGYLDTTKLIIREFSVLVTADTDFYGKWTIYGWNGSAWSVRSIQDYDVSSYWNYIDWYADGYNQFTTINFTVDGTYLLPSLQNDLGSVVKVNSTGSGGWLLLEKTSNIDTEDYTQAYKVIGRENGTIELKESLYNYQTNATGFDNRSFDSFFYDNNPIVELRIILQALRDDVFVGSLKEAYNDLFFVSVRYLLAEQNSVDWLFKTSFVKAKYHVSELRNDVTFNSDNLQSFEDYLHEVKPYKTKIREYINVYDKIEPTNTSVSDFDLPPYYSVSDGKIVPNRAVFAGGTIRNTTDEFETYPRKHYIENVGYELTDIIIKDGGSGYTFKPTVVIEGQCTRQAKAEAFIGYGKLTKIIITDPGAGYLTQPTVTINGSQTSGSTAPRLSAIIGNSPVRTPHIRVKFDRVSGKVFIETLAETETFVGSAVNLQYDLEWPMDLNRTNVKVTVDGKEMLRSTYAYENVVDTTKSYTRQHGRITFTEAPEADTTIVVTYKKPVDMLLAQDRIQHFYSAETGLPGKDFAQLMKGIDYGGVEVTSFGFEGAAGFDTTGWFTDTWDTFDNTYEDEVFVADGSTIFVELSKPLEDGVVYNVYRGQAGSIDLTRIDDPNYGTPQQTNDDAIMQSLTGDDSTTIINLDDLGVSFEDGETLIVRKTTSDGSILPDPTSYDTQLSGGDLPYNSATGVNAEDIIVDGDAFVNPITHAGPEELVPGLITDSLDIKVYTRDGTGNGVIYSQNYITDGTTTEFNLGTIPSTNEAVIVKLDDIRLADTEYSIDSNDLTLTFNTAPAANQELSIISQSLGVDDLLDYGKTITDGSTTEIITTVDWVDGASVSASVDGEPLTIIVFNSEDEGYDLDNPKVGIRFEEAILEGRVVHYAVFSNDDVVNYSRVISNTFTGDGTVTSYTLDDVPFTQVPLEHKIIVKVGNNILNPGYNIKHTIPANNQKTYAIERFQQAIGTLDVQEIKVFLNGVEIENPVQFTYDVANASIVLTDETGEPGDVVEIFAIADGEYAFGYLNDEGAWIDTPGTLHFDTAPNGEVTVYQFSNHDILGIERINYDVVDRASTTITSEQTTYRLLKSGVINLRSTAVDAQYVWVIKNGELLSPSVDYYISDDKGQVVLTERPADDDVIDIMHFTAPVGTSKFAYRQFKDMLNRTHYKRLDKFATKLREPLNYYDQRIEVVDGTQLPEPNKSNNLPGIIFINGERIEYFVKEENTLRQIRRGTLGTGVKDTHAVGSKIYDQNVSKTIPYQDRTIQKRFVADGLTTDFDPGFDVANINQVEVFVAGTRLRKSDVASFDPTRAQDSTEGDITLPAEFTVSSNTIQITDAPQEDTTVVIVKKTGSLWSDQGEQLSLAENSIARFLRAGTSELPE